MTVNVSFTKYRGRQRSPGTLFSSSCSFALFTRLVTVETRHISKCDLIQFHINFNRISSFILVLNFNLFCSQVLDFVKRKAVYFAVSGLTVGLKY